MLNFIFCEILNLSNLLCYFLSKRENDLLAYFQSAIANIFFLNHQETNINQLIYVNQNYIQRISYQKSYWFFLEVLRNT